MGTIQDFKCTYDNAAGINSEVTSGLGLTFPDAYLHADTMAKLSKAMKVHDGAGFCELPFCHTVEGEAMGGIVNLGDEKAGPRAKEYLTTKMEDILDLPKIDYSKGRIHEVLLACEKLRKEGEQVVLEVSGPFTILNVLIDARYVFRTMRKNPELGKKVMWKLGNEMLRYIEEAQKYGVQLFSYADSSGGVNILGPKMMEQVVEDFTYEYMKKMLEITRGKSLILLCPKTTFALLGTDKAELVERRLSGAMRYGEGCIESIGKLSIVGQTCIKNIGFQLTKGSIKEVVLK